MMATAAAVIRIASQPIEQKLWPRHVLVHGRTVFRKLNSVLHEFRHQARHPFGRTTYVFEFNDRAGLLRQHDRPPRMGVTHEVVTGCRLTNDLSIRGYSYFT